MLPFRRGPLSDLRPAPGMAMPTDRIPTDIELRCVRRCRGIAATRSTLGPVTRTFTLCEYRWGQYRPICVIGALLDHVAPLDTPELSARPANQAGLRREHDLIPPIPQRLADDLLSLAGGVDVGGVDEVEARVDGAVDHAHRLGVIGIALGPDHHGAESRRAHRDAGRAERAS